MSWRQDYRRGVDDYSREVGWTLGKVFWRVVLPMAIFLIGVGALGHACGWFGEAATVAKQEFGPRALLDKYEWFKDAAAALDKKRADLAIYDRRLVQLAADYAGQSRSEWTREDREGANVLRAEADGVRLSYNRLAADYNAQMAKFNWRFTNVGDLPPGATQPLPREFKPYDEGGSR